MEQGDFLRLLEKWIEYQNGDDVTIHGMRYQDFYDTLSQEAAEMVCKWDRKTPWSEILEEMHGASRAVHCRYIRLPPPSSERFNLECAVMNYLGYQKWDYRGQNRPMAYARVMAAITDELEAMKQEGIWTPPEG